MATRSSLALLPLERADRCVPNEAADVSNAELATPRASRAEVRSSFSQWDAVTERELRFSVEPPEEAALHASLDEALTGRRTQGHLVDWLQFRTALSLVLSAADSKIRLQAGNVSCNAPSRMARQDWGTWMTWPSYDEMPIAVNSCCHIILMDVVFASIQCAGGTCEAAGWPSRRPPGCYLRTVVG